MRRSLAAAVALASCVCVAGALRGLSDDPRRAAAAGALALAGAALSAATALGAAFGLARWLRHVGLGVAPCVLVGSAGTLGYLRWGALPRLARAPARGGDVSTPAADALGASQRLELRAEIEGTMQSLAWVVGGAICLTAAAALMKLRSDPVRADRA